MIRFKGTKGKWILGDEKNYNGNKAFEVWYGNDGECVAEVVHKIEDAKLIAAAPELLEALLYYFDVLEEVRGKDFKDKPDHVLSKMINAVNNALS